MKFIVAATVAPLVSPLALPPKPTPSPSSSPYDADEITSSAPKVSSSPPTRSCRNNCGCVNTAEPACSAASATGPLSATSLVLWSPLCAQLSGLATGAHSLLLPRSLPPPRIVLLPPPLLQPLTQSLVPRRWLLPLPPSLPSLLPSCKFNVRPCYKFISVIPSVFQSYTFRSFYK
ncbi:hypothetical protein BC829DRAFT_396417 [Chytridium lagenaria]|nr:hypothetical protein BC829DRAFT_396417 [Chytridium lagenaria]